MKRITIILFCISMMQVFTASAQQVWPVFITTLPDSLYESSGVELNDRNSIWIHNDSGDTARLFKTDTNGNLLRILFISGVDAIDWEDLTQDTEGNYFIGDFGNNYNNRTDLKIYIIPNPDSISGDSVTPGVISYTYPDQFGFPPDSTLLNFDCEAMFHLNDSLYLFSKNRGISTFTKMYRIPDQAGNYVAELIDSFDTQHWITSGDISPSGKVMILLSETNIWLFTGFLNSDFFGGSATHLSMDYSQKEAIVFISDNEVYMTDELFMGVGGNIYYLYLAPWLNLPDLQAPLSDNVNIYPNPSVGTYTLEVPEGARSIQVIDQSGTIIKDIISGGQTRWIMRDYETGVYLIRVIMDYGTVCRKVIVIKNDLTE